MIKKDYVVVERQNMRDGEGVVTIKNWMTDEEKPTNVRLAASIVLPEGASIGAHMHEGESEIFHVITGAGTYLDDGKHKAVKAGDTMICYDGHSHGIKNGGCGELVMSAVIISV